MGQDERLISKSFQEMKDLNISTNLKHFLSLNSQVYSKPNGFSFLHNRIVHHTSKHIHTHKYFYISMVCHGMTWQMNCFEWQHLMSITKFLIVCMQTDANTFMVIIAFSIHKYTYTNQMYSVTFGFYYIGWM